MASVGAHSGTSLEFISPRLILADERRGGAAGQGVPGIPALQTDFLFKYSGKMSALGTTESKTSLTLRRHLWPMGSQSGQQQAGINTHFGCMRDHGLQFPSVHAFFCNEFI